MLFTIAICISAYARTVSEVRSMLVGEWVGERQDSDFPGYTVYNADGTGAERVIYFLGEGDLFTFTWELVDPNTLRIVVNPQTICRETLNIIDTNNIRISGVLYRRRGTGSSTSTVTAPSAPSSPGQSSGGSVSSNAQQSVVLPKATVSIFGRAELTNFLKRPFGYDQTNAGGRSGELFKKYCAENKIKYTESRKGKDTYINVNDRSVKLFGRKYVVTVYWFDDSPGILHMYLKGERFTDEKECKQTFGFIKGMLIGFGACFDPENSDKDSKFVMFKMPEGYNGSLSREKNRIVIYLHP